MRSLALFWCVLIVVCESSGQHLTQTEVTVRVVDEDGRPVTNALVGIGFDQGGNAWIGERKGENPKGASDAAGLFSAAAKCTGSLGASAKKEGYYSWGNQFYFYRPGEKRDGPWRPFDPMGEGVTAVLRKIGNPVPMYARKVRTEIPAINAPIGYDLMIGDWVMPHGKGEVADFVFTMQSRVAGWKDFETHLSLTFTSVHDGIQTITEGGPVGSVFRLPRSARDSGYCPFWTNSIGYIPDKGFFQTQVKDCPGYMFRVRSVTDENGNLVCSLYGKIRGPVEFDGRDSKTGSIFFTYYLNPTPNDRNLEFDPARNLFANLSSREEVREP